MLFCIQELITACRVSGATRDFWYRCIAIVSSNGFDTRSLKCYYQSSTSETDTISKAPKLADSHGTVRISLTPRSSNLTRLSFDQCSPFRHSATGTIWAISCEFCCSSRRNSRPKVIFSEESDPPCFLCDVEDLGVGVSSEAVCGAVCTVKGVFVGDIDGGDRGTRKSVGGGAGAVTFGTSNARQSVGDGVVMTINQSPNL